MIDTVDVLGLKHNLFYVRCVILFLAVEPSCVVLKLLKQTHQFVLLLIGLNIQVKRIQMSGSLSINVTSSEYIKLDQSKYTEGLFYIS